MRTARDPAFALMITNAAEQVSEENEFLVCFYSQRLRLRTVNIVGP